MNTVGAVTRWVVVTALMLVPTVVAAQSSSQFDQVIGHVKDVMQTDPAQAASAAKKARLLAQKIGGDKLGEHVATADWLEGEALVRMNRLVDAKPLIEHGILLARKWKVNEHLQGDLLLSRGGIAFEKTDIAEALKDYQGAYNIFRNVGDERNQSRSLIQIASIYNAAMDFQNALKYFSEALDVYKGDPGLIVSIYNNRGNAFADLKRFKEAENDFSGALALAERMGSPLLKMVVLANIARTHIRSGSFRLAAPALNEGLRLAELPDARGFRTTLFGLATQAALAERNQIDAARYTALAFNGVDLTRTTVLDRDAHEAAYRTYAALGRDDLALAHLAALKRLDDEATALARSTNAALMAARFDFANQEVRIAKLKADDLQKSVAYERTRARTQRWVLLAGTGIALAVAALSWVGLLVIRRSRNQTRAANVELGQTNAALGKALAAKTEFLATTSHEIRTPLNGILGMTQVMLADGTIPAAMRDRVDVVHAAGLTMRALVDDILDVAKMESGRLTIEAAPFALDETLARAAAMWREQAAAKQLDFHVDLARCPRCVVGDEARVRQILFNLVSNAIKFTAAGAVTVTAERTADARWRLSVADTGIGIDPAKHDEIFESFRQADAGTTRQFGGTGLGLAICRQLAAAMGGTIALESTPGAGSRFVVELPLVEASAAVAAAPPCAPAAWLVVDRNPITRAMLRNIVADCDPAVQAVADLDAATAAVAAGGIERLVIDESAGGDAATVGGLAALTPVVLLARPGTVAAAPGITLIDKPITRDELARRLREIGQKTADSPLVSQAA